MKAEYINHMGDDTTVVNAARVSFNKEVEELSHKDYGLIKFLAKHNHWTPFSHPQIMVRETVPIFVARQRFKHMVGFTYNEVSRRYVDDMPEFYMPEYFRERAENVKQGSSDSEADYNPWRYEAVVEACLSEYDRMLNSGVCPEQARMILPQGIYTSYYVTGSLAAWARAYKQRSDSHAQKEIQDLAAQWDSIIRPLFPASWEELTK